MTHPAPTLPPFEPATLVGSTLDGRYLIEAHLATGGMGAVFRARHVGLRKDVALKVLRPDLSASAELVERFRREAEIAAGLQHDHIVHVTDFGRSPEGWLFIAMEMLIGESLFDRLRREQWLPPEETVTILWQVCAGLEVAHERGVVHRDLKPENVFLARTADGREVAKILDFGIAKMADPSSDSATAAGMVVGTPEYLAPEQATGSPVDGRADLYTVGIIAWRALVGRHPFRADDPRSLLMMQATRAVPRMDGARQDLSAWPGLVEAVARACAKDPADRQQTAAELKADLATAVGPGFVPPVGPFTTGRTLSSVGRTQTPGGTMPLGSTLPPLVPPSPLAAPRPGPAVEEAAREAAAGLAGRSRASRRALVVAGLAAVAAVALGAGIFLREDLRGPGPVPVTPMARPADPPAAPPAAQPPAPAPPAAPADPLDAPRALLQAGRTAEARAALEPLAAARPDDPRVQLLLGHALHAAGASSQAMAAWERARAGGSLDPAALELLVADLSLERPLADRAARLLARSGPAAAEPLSAVMARGTVPVKLRALAVAREIGPAARIDVVGGYLALLGDDDCAVRRAAARALGEMGDRRALRRLEEAAAARKETRSLLGVIVKSEPVCGAAEAGDAAQRIARR